MNIGKIVTATLLVAAVITISLGCGPKSEEAATAEYQEVTVQRGNLAVEITATGNLALSQTEELTFDIGGTVEEVLVDEGDTVTEGQVLARLDASEWEDYLEDLADKLTAAQRQVRAKERALTKAKINLDAKERAVAAKERELLQAQIDVQSAQRAVDVMQDVQEAQDAVDEAEYNLQIAQMRLKEALQSTGEGDPAYWANEVKLRQQRLQEARNELNEILTDPYYGGVTISEVYLKQLQLQLAKAKLAAAEEAVAAAKVDVTEAREDIADAETALADARQDLADAQEELDEARQTSLEIVAPFDGFITKVNIEGGDEVLKGTVALQIADPNKFEADILVSEMDIMQVKLGGEARVEVDALPGVTLPAEVTHIAPTATIQAGVVNYQVKVEVKSPQAMVHKQPARQKAMPDIAAGQLPPRLSQAVDEGRLTREQAEEIMRRIREGGGPPPGGLPGMPPPAGMPRTQPGQSPPITSLKDIQLREGLTVLVTITVEERNDVLLVPNQAITHQGTESYVRVSTDGTIEQRLVKTGISDWQFTEITAGLSEGETVLVPQGTTTPATGTQQPSPPPLFFPPPPRRR